MFIRFLIASSILLRAIAVGQQVPTPVESRSRRLANVKSLADDIWSHSADDNARITKDYAANHINQIRGIIRDEVLETLNRTGEPADVREAVASLLGGMGEWAAEATPYVYSTDLNGVKTVVVAYPWFFGTTAIPRAAVTIQGYRSLGAAYALADETGKALDDCGLILDRLSSPRGNEVWLLAHGQVFGFMGHEEVIRIYSFDGYSFKELWAPEAPRISPEYAITNDAVTVTYFGPNRGTPYNKQQDRLRDTIRLTTGGTIVSTETIPSR